MTTWTRQDCIKLHCFQFCIQATVHFGKLVKVGSNSSLKLLNELVNIKLTLGSDLIEKYDFDN